METLLTGKPGKFETFRVLVMVWNRVGAMKSWTPVWMEPTFRNTTLLDPVYDEHIETCQRAVDWGGAPKEYGGAQRSLSADGKSRQECKTAIRGSVKLSRTSEKSSEGTKSKGLGVVRWFRVVETGSIRLRNGT